jgi:hypothetical protein
MNRRRRLSACRSFSVETLEQRSMLAADCVEGSFAVEVTDLSNEVVQESPTDVSSLSYDTSEDSPLPFDAVPMDDTANSLPFSGEAEPVTEPEEPFIGIGFGMDDGMALEASFSLLVCPPEFQFETTGLIAFEPEVRVDPVLTLEVATGELQFINGDTWNTVTLVESGLQLTSEVVDLTKNSELDADGIMLVYARSLFWCGAGVPTESGDVDAVVAPVESPAADSTSDDEAQVVASSSGGSSPSTALSAATAQAFAAFATSFGQGGTDGPSGQPIVGGRRVVRR